jgi:translation elongation factor aEF-1 beta
MGKVIAIYKIFPEGIDEIEIIKKELKKVVKPPVEIKDLKEEQFAYGLRVLRIAFLMPDKTEGLIESLEKTLKNMNGVSQIENEGVNLIS